MNRDEIIAFLRDFKARHEDQYGIISLACSAESLAGISAMIAMWISTS